MNYAFKMIAVVLALGVMVLQGCQTTGTLNYKNDINLSPYNQFRKLEFKIGNVKYDSFSAFFQGKNLFGFYAKGILFYEREICNWNSNITNRTTRTGSFKASCPSGLRVNGKYTYVGSYAGSNGSGFDSKGRKVTYKLSGSGSSSRQEIINYYNTNFKSNSYSTGNKFNVKNKFINELKEEEKKTIRLEQQIRALKSQDKINKRKIKNDNEIPIILASSRMISEAKVIISGKITDNLAISEVLIDNYPIMLESNGSFNAPYYVPRTGKTIEIIAFDIKGNKAVQTLRIERGNIQQASSPTFDKLNPSRKKVKSNKNAFALIIGVANYEKTPSNALYADKDAKQFYDYAVMKLGIPSSNIKELVNDNADLGEILITVKDWLRRSAKPNKSDIYIFFAGHGLSSQDGSKMYLLPYNGRPRLLEYTALQRDELFNEIKQANPRSVTVFLDTCYSGVTRNEEMLIAGRPIVIKAKEQAIPDGFTLFSAASNEQISRPLEEAKHGMFSYFLMKGMEGDADANNDDKITARELHAYVEQNVVQQSSGSQTPELQGDKDRVLVQFN